MWLSDEGKIYLFILAAVMISLSAVVSYTLSFCVISPTFSIKYQS